MAIYKEIFSALAMAITFIAFFPYIRSILKNKIRPHVFSWIIWGSTTIIVFFVQLEGGGGIGAWPIGISGLITIYIAFLAYKNKSDASITKMDCCFFLLAIASLPFWYFTSDPLWAVIILTIVDTLGFGPTFRKAYQYPYEENLLLFMLFLIRNIIVIFALEFYSLTTVMFPAIIAVATLMLILVILNRRHVLSKVI